MLNSDDRNDVAEVDDDFDQAVEVDSGNGDNQGVVQEVTGVEVDTLKERVASTTKSIQSK